MKITPELVQSVADLARLALTDAEVEALSAQLSEQVEYFEQLDELDTSGIEPTSHAVPLACPQREDVVRPSADRQTVLAQAPRGEEGFFVVPKVID